MNQKARIYRINKEMITISDDYVVMKTAVGVKTIKKEFINM